MTLIFGGELVEEGILGLGLQVHEEYVCARGTGTAGVSGRSLDAEIRVGGDRFGEMGPVVIFHRPYTRPALAFVRILGVSP
jgi:hypothetical protein